MNKQNEESITVEWPNFGEALGQDMWQFFMADEYSDVTISTEEGDKIRSHRIILAMCSPYFRELFKMNNTTNPIVCLSNMRFDIVKMVLQLIYGGAVNVPAREMRSFVRAAKYLKLQGFENITPTVSVDDIQSADRIQRHRNYSIVLKRIDETNFAMNTSNDGAYDSSPIRPTSPATTNGDDRNGGTSSSSDDSCSGSVSGNNDDIDDVNNGYNIERLSNGFTLSSSSSSESEGGDYDGGREIELISDVAVE